MSRTFLQGCSLSSLVVAVLLACVSSAAQGWDVRWQTDLKSAARESQREQKPMLIEFTASWCRYCTKMKQTTFRDRGVIQHVNGCFVPVSVDADKHKELMKAVGVTGLPSTVIVSPKFEVVTTITGYQSPTDMSRKLAGFCPRHSAKRQATPQAWVKTGTGTATVAPPAFGGRCVVSMLDDRKLRNGSAKFVSRYRGRTLQFASLEHKRRFDANPAKYWPAADGDCPVTLRENAVRIAGRPASAAIYRGRLWFFASKEQRKQFAESPAKYVATQAAKRDGSRQIR